MYTLTELRREKVLTELNEYRRHFESHSDLDCTGFEMLFRNTLDNCGYIEVKDIVVQLSKEPEFERLSAHYMQYQNPTGPVTEFHAPLARIYGAGSYQAADFEAKKDAYWRSPSSGTA